MTSEPENTISYQGEPGANSHIACREVYPDLVALDCASFEDALEAVESRRARLAMIPIENSTAGRVADIHTLLPESSLFIVGEHFQPIHHALVAPKGSTKEGLTDVYSHVQALGQCRKALRSLNVTPQNYADTAGAARFVAETGKTEFGAISSELAAEIYGLDVLASNIEDMAHNTTRFVVLAREALEAKELDCPVMTTFTFEVRSVPAALYKALGGFATNGVNITKLESYIRDASFQAAEFYADIVGSEEDPAVQRAMEELRFHTKWVKVLGTYPQEAKRTG